MGIAILANGCTAQITIGNQVPAVQTDVKTEAQVTSKLQSAQKDQARLVRALSAGQYTCSLDTDATGRTTGQIVKAEPIPPKNQTTPASTSPGDKPKAPVTVPTVGTSVGNSNTERQQAVTAALQFLGLYQSTLSSIAQKSQSALNEVSADKQTAEGVITTAGSWIPGFGSTAASAANAGIDAVETIWQDATIQITNDQIVKYAQGMQAGLGAAVATLKSNYEAFVFDGKNAFKGWDDCSRAIFFFVRDLPRPDTPLKDSQNQPLSRYFAQSDGAALVNYWSDYQASRTQYKGMLITQQQYDSDLDAVVKQNDSLSKGLSLDLSTTKSTLSDLAAKLQAACSSFTKASGTTTPTYCTSKS